MKTTINTDEQIFLIDLDGAIIKENYSEKNAFMKNVVKFGNCFRTQAEALAAVERVKKALKGE